MASVVAFDGTIDNWLGRASSAVTEGLHPERVSWSVQDESLFGTIALHALPCAPPTLFTKLARSVACHRDVTRWDALYAVLWRLVRGEPELLAVVTDPMVHRLVQMHRAVKRASHKMKAFVRFRRMGDEGDPSYVAWFEPAHLVVERTAPFFARRFPSMRWSILTPERSAHWDTRELSFSAGISRDTAPTGDDLEDLWRTYYANIFNPARLNDRAMRKEMPARYWSGLPEASLIRELHRDAPARVAEMLTQIHAPPEPLPADLEPTPREIARVSPLDTPSDWDPVHDPGAAEARRRHVVLGEYPRCLNLGETRIDFGVAGWTDPSLLAAGVFYPPECSTPELRLRYYASRYSMVEVDATYYAPPTRAMAAAWAARTPDDFTFDVKAHALMTGHPADYRKLPDWIRRQIRDRRGDARVYGSGLPTELLDEVWSRFRSALEPIRAAGKLGAIMLQFPRWFEPTRESAETLRRARERLGEDLGTVEFRNRAWMEGRIAERTIALLTELGLSYVVVDAPPGMQSSMPNTVAVTNPKLCVFRFHGRRTATWEAKNDPVTERYRYLYDREQLGFWRSKVLETAFNVARVHMTFNNNHANYATTNAAEMSWMLKSDASRTPSEEPLVADAAGSREPVGDSWL